MNADGTNQRLLFASSDFDNERPSFTPDGMTVVFTRCQLPFETETCALYRIGVDGSGLTALTNFEFAIQDLSGKYSPDNESLAFTSVAREGITCAIYLTRTQGQGLHQLTPAQLLARQPDWSPDGKRIAFSTHFANVQNQEIWVVNATGGGLRQITSSGDGHVGGPHDVFPSWSPRGDAIVFERDAPDFSSFSIYVVRFDGGGFTQPLALRTREAVSRARAAHNRRMGNARHHVALLEEGGGLPQWGPSPD